jgi:hypothetical protein
MSKKKSVSIKAGGLLVFGVLLPFVVAACSSHSRGFRGEKGSGGETSAAGAPDGGTTSGGEMNAAAGSGDEGGDSGQGGGSGQGGETSGGSGGERPGSAGDANTAGQGGCTADSDCESPETDPPGCTEAKCEMGACSFLSRDADGDGERALHCEAKDSTVSVTSGLDCDDHDVEINPGRTETCDGKDTDCNGLVDDGVSVSTTPCTVGLGVCQGKGFLECSDGKYSKCNAVPAAQPSKDTKECNLVDTNCNGTIDTAGCTCTSADKKLTCAQTCGTDYQVTCKTDGTWPACDPGPNKQEYCPDNDRDGYPGSCASYCPNAVPSGWQAKSAFGGKATDCDDSKDNRYPGRAEVCDGVDNDCSASTGEPNVSCGACPAVACGGTCKQQCPAGYTAQSDGSCLSNAETAVIRDDPQVCASFPCAGLRQDFVLTQACGAGNVRSSIDIFASLGTGNCSGTFVNSDPNDCSVNIHYGAAFCDCFTCSRTVRVRRKIAQCQ